MARHLVTVTPLPAWLPTDSLLGPGPWRREGAALSAELDTPAAADLAARLHGVVLAGASLAMTVQPPLKRPAVRAARTDEARRRRDATPGFTRANTRLDDDGRVFLTPEALALTLGERAKVTTVIDACCGAGGNAIGFARAGAQVLAIDTDPERLALARHNASVYGVAARIRFLQGDACVLAPQHPAELLFVDPPWGPDYRAPSTLADHPVVAELAAAWQGPLWAKLPPAFDPTSWPAATPEAWLGRAAGDNRRVKFLLLRRASAN